MTATTNNTPRMVQITKALKALDKKDVASIIEKGRLLQEASDECEPGHYMAWLKTEIDWSYDTAKRLCSVYRLSKTVDLTKLNISTTALYLVAEMQDGDPMRELVISAARVSWVSHQLANDIIKAAHAAAEKDPRTDKERDKLLETMRAIRSKTEARGAEPGEAASAAAKLAEMMAKYKVTEAELGPTDEAVEKVKRVAEEAERAKREEQGEIGYPIESRPCRAASTLTSIHPTLPAAAGLSR
jgi:hypothetical protein